MYSEIEENRFLEVTYAGRRQGDPLLQGLQLGRDDPEHRRPGQEDGDQGLPHRRARRASASSTCSPAASTSSRRTRTCPTRPTPTTGRGSRARRASGSSTSAPSSTARTAPSRAGPSTTSPTRASTSRERDSLRLRHPGGRSRRGKDRSRPGQGTVRRRAHPRCRAYAHCMIPRYALCDGGTRDGKRYPLHREIRPGSCSRGTVHYGAPGRATNAGSMWVAPPPGSG